MSASHRAKYVVAEALTNIAKYAHASSARISVHRHGARLSVDVADNGRGGADRTLGSGLSGLADSVTALGGHLRIMSPPGAGTTVTADLPTAHAWTKKAVTGGQAAASREDALAGHCRRTQPPAARHDTRPDSGRMCETITRSAGSSLTRTRSARCLRTVRDGLACLV